MRKDIAEAFNEWFQETLYGKPPGFHKTELLLAFKAGAQFQMLKERRSTLILQGWKRDPDTGKPL